MDYKKISENIARLLNENNIKAEANIYALFPDEYTLNNDKVLVWYVSSPIIEIPKPLTNHNFISNILTIENMKFVATILSQSELETPNIDNVISNIETIINGIRFNGLAPITILNITALSMTQPNVYCRQIYFNIQYSHQVIIKNETLK